MKTLDLKVKAKRPFFFHGSKPRPEHHRAFCLCCTDDSDIDVDRTFHTVTAALENPDSTNSGSVSWNYIPNNLVTSTALVGSLVGIVGALT